MMQRDKETVLIIDDEPNIRKSLSDILRMKGYEPVACGTGREGLDLALRDSINLVIIDLRLPDMSGIEVLKSIKAISPVTEAIILTGNADLESAIEATNQGAFSYLLKPYDVDQLLLHLSRAMDKLRDAERLRKQSAELEKANSELKTLYEEAKTFSLHDPLTGLGNRRLLQIYMDKGIGSAERYGSTFTVLMVDIDRFKNFNDTYGQAEGDRLLIRLSNILAREVRCADWVFRYGGEEFLVMLPDTDSERALEVAERLRKAVEDKAGVTVSIGVAQYAGPLESKEEQIERADSALYRAKDNGRNRVEVDMGDRRMRG